MNKIIMKELIIFFIIKNVLLLCLPSGINQINNLIYLKEYHFILTK